MNGAAWARRPAETEPTPVNAVVECVDLACTFGRGERSVAAVHDVSMAVPVGLCVALMGPSGSGKSTLLHLLAGLEAPTAGVVRWPALGGSPLGRPGIVGMIFQGPSLVPALNVVENVALPLVLAGADPLEAAEESARQSLAQLGIPELAGKLPGELSGGQAQRVALARVLAGRPRLILADEPTGRLDHRTAAHVIDVLLGTAQELGAALILSTHDAQIAARLPCLWQMCDGRLDAAADSSSRRAGTVAGNSAP